MDANTLKALKSLAVKKENRPLNELVKEAAKRYLPDKAAEDADAQLFLKRAKEPLENCLAAIERHIARIKKQRA